MGSEMCIRDRLVIVMSLGFQKLDSVACIDRRSSSKKVDPPCRPTPLLQPDAIIHLLIGGYNPTLSVRTWSAAWLCAIMTVERLVELRKHYSKREDIGLCTFISVYSSSSSWGTASRHTQEETPGTFVVSCERV